MDSKKLPNVKIVLLGDSTVQDYPLDNDRRGWGQVLADYLTDQVSLVNLAMGGRSTKTFIAEGRLDQALPEKTEKTEKTEKADYALIQFGHNDSHDKDKPESTDADGDYKVYLKQYIDAFTAKDVRMVFITPMHRRIFYQGKLDTSLNPYRNAMKDVAQSHGQPVVDLYEQSEILIQALGSEGSAYLYCNEKDRTHFSPAGAAVMALLILQDLQRQNHPLGAYIKPDVALMLRQTPTEKLAPKNLMNPQV